MSQLRVRHANLKPLLAGHPWVFAQAVDKIEGAPAPGAVVDVVDPKGAFIGRGFYSPKSAIPVRILSRDPSKDLNGAWLGAAIDRAVALRLSLGLPNARTTAFRAVHSEGDGLGGLIVDVYGEVATVQFLTIGMKERADTIIGHLARALPVRTFIGLAVPNLEKLEGFTSEQEVLRGPDARELRYKERGLEFTVPTHLLQKTGAYLDQRDNRALVERVAKGARVLDAFCHLGAFGLTAARAGATEVLGIDRSAQAVQLAASAARENGLQDIARFSRLDCKRALPALHQDGERFDVVILDPPKLIPSSRHLHNGRRAYRRLNANGLKLVRSPGWLITCSCSAALKQNDFLRAIAIAARDAGRTLQLVDVRSQGPDHPTPPAFDAGRYLKTCLFRVQ